MRRFSVVAVFGLMVVFGATARGQELSPLEVVYSIHENAQDPNSPVKFEISLLITPENVSGNEVGWRLTEVGIQQLEQGAPVASWSHLAPTVSTPDGLWWVTHAEPTAPAAAEFFGIPTLSGQAAPEDPDHEPLNYSFSTQALTYSTEPWPATTTLSHSLELAISQTVLTEEEEQPTDLAERRPPGQA